MRPVLLIFVSLSLVLQVQGAASLLSDCLNLGNACKMEMSAGSNCGCEHAGDLHMLPTASGDCPYGCLNCNLEAHAPDILLSLPSISRTALFNGALRGCIENDGGRMVTPTPWMYYLTLKSPRRRHTVPMTEWGVWRL
jgi:hypothetical protein